LRLGEHARDRAELEGRAGAPLEERGWTPSTTSPEASAATASPRARTGCDAPALRRRAVGAARDHDHGGGADEVDRAARCIQRATRPSAYTRASVPEPLYWS